MAHEIRLGMGLLPRWRRIPHAKQSGWVMRRWRIGLGALSLLGLLVSVAVGELAEEASKAHSCGQQIGVCLNSRGASGADSGRHDPSLSGLVAPFRVVSVLSSNGPGIDSGAETFDVSSAGHMLPYAAGSDALHGFGRVHGGIYFNHDGTNLYVGVAGYSKQGTGDGEDALLILLDARPGGVTGLDAIQSGPRGLRVTSNLRFQAGVFEPDVALLLGSKRVDGRNDWTAQLGGKEYGQGVFSLSGHAASHLTPAFTESGPSPISQWGDSPCSTDLANAGIEVAIPLSNVLTTAWTPASTTIISAAAIILGGDDGRRRCLSSEAYGESARGGFGYNDTVLIGQKVRLSSQAAPGPLTSPLFNDSEVMVQGFGWNVPRPLRCYYRQLAVVGSFNGWDPSLGGMTPIGDDMWEYLCDFTNSTRVEFMFAANGGREATWGESNRTVHLMSVANGIADYKGKSIVVDGPLNGRIRFRFNTTRQTYSIDAAPAGTDCRVQEGYALCYWYTHLRRLAESNEFSRFSRVWMPPPQKCMNSAYSTGYDPYDYYDLGESDQQGSVETRYGSADELKACIRALSDRGIDCIADLVLNHMDEGMPGRRGFGRGNRKMDMTPDATGADSECFNVNGFNYPFQYDHGYGLYTNTLDPGSCLVAHSMDVNELHPDMRNGLMNWVGWLNSHVGFMGARFDFSQGMEPFFFSELMGTEAMKGRFAVMEYWSDAEHASAREHETWVNLVDRRACSFDMPLSEKLKAMCNSDGAFNMEELASGALMHVVPDRAVTFVESHDTVRPFAEGGYKGVMKDKALAYAFILFSDGCPCVFYQDYFGQPYADGTSETGWRGAVGELRPYIDAMIDVRRQYAGGSTIYLSTADKQDLFIAKRSGATGKDGCILALNDHMGLTLTDTVDTDWPDGTVLVDALDPNHEISVHGNGFASLSVPCRGYRVYVRKGRGAVPP